MIFGPVFKVAYISRVTSVSIAAELQAWPGFDSRQGQGFFFTFATVSRPALGPT